MHGVYGHMSVLIVDLTEVTAQPSAETRIGLNHRGHRGHREKKEESSGDSLSVASASSVVKHLLYAEGMP